MKTYVVLLRGINVGGKNKIPMVDLKRYLEEQDFEDVVTYIQSGNVLLRTDLNAKTVGNKVETMLSQKFKSDSANIKALALTTSQLQAVFDKKPKGFGDQPAKYHSDVVFLMGIDTADATAVFRPRDGVDAIWPGDGVIYSQRLSALRTKSRLNAIVGTPAYKSMTIRNWNTTLRLLELSKAMDQ
jgi:uncharacterized protein (DUF1697 family)